MGFQGVGAGVKQWLGGRKFGGIDLCEPLEIRVEKKREATGGGLLESWG